MRASDPAQLCEDGTRAEVARIEAMGCAMPWLASLLGRFAFQTEVVDRSGLTGS
jgi:hypothetical protein